MKDLTWFKTAEHLPPDNKPVEIITTSGDPGVLYYQDRLWWTLSLVYVYYTPKYWRPIK